MNLIRHADELIDTPMDYIVWFYGEYNQALSELEKDYPEKLTTVQGIPTDIDSYIDKNRQGLHIYDDLMAESAGNKKLTEIFSRKTQHCNLSWILINQNLFHEGKERRNFYRCCHYLCIFNNNLDRSVPFHVASKVLPRNPRLFLKIFEIAADRPNGYLFIDGRQTTPSSARFRTDLFKGYQRVFIPEV